MRRLGIRTSIGGSGWTIFERPPWIKDSATAPDKVADKSNVEEWVW
jgi:hypothetical protein